MVGPGDLHGLVVQPAVQPAPSMSGRVNSQYGKPGMKLSGSATMSAPPLPASRISSHALAVPAARSSQTLESWTAAARNVAGSVAIVGPRDDRGGGLGSASATAAGGASVSGPGPNRSSRASSLNAFQISRASSMSDRSQSATAMPSSQSGTEAIVRPSGSMM